MHIVLLAAGKGSRIGALTEAKPKALVAVEGATSILDLNLRNFCSSGLQGQILVVGGHRWDQIVEFIKRHEPICQIACVRNPDYDVAGPLRSIRVAIRALPAEARGLVVANGDTIFSKSMFRQAQMPGPDGVTLVGSSEAKPTRDDIRIVCGDNGYVAKAAKAPNLATPSDISAGFLIVRGRSSVAAFAKAVDDLIAVEDESGRQLTWHSTVEALAGAGIPVTSQAVPRHWWFEFDSQLCVESYRQSRNHRSLTPSYGC